MGIDGEAETDEEFLKNFEKNLKAMEKLTWDLVIFESMGQLLSRGVKNLLKGMEKPQLPKESESRFLDFETKTSLDYLAGAMQELLLRLSNCIRRTELSLSTVRLPPNTFKRTKATN